MEGACLCGAIKVKVTDDELFTKPRSAICHCENCQKIHGLHGTSLVIEISKVSITGEENMKVFLDGKTISKTPVERYFCSTCGCPIQSKSPHFAGKTALKLGIFPKIPAPAMELFVVDRQDWEKPFAGCMQFKTLPGGETV